MPTSTIDVLRQSFLVPGPPLTEKNAPDQKGNVFLVTGGYGGVGLELTQLLFQLNATIYIAGRDEAKAQGAITKIQASNPTSKGKLEYLKLDLSDLSSIKASAESLMQRESRLNVLVNNAGVNSPPEGSKTAQGYDLQLGTNCLGPFLFTKCLLPILRTTAKSSPAGAVRVLWTSSVAVELGPVEGITVDADGTPQFGTDKAMNYNMSKAGNLFYGVEFAKRYREDGILSIPLNPGNLKTDIMRHFQGIQASIMRSMFHPAKYGAYTNLYAALSSDIKTENSGSYVVPWGHIGGVKKVVKSIKRKDEGGTGDAEKFWMWSDRVTSEYA